MAITFESAFKEGLHRLSMMEIPPPDPETRGSNNYLNGWSHACAAFRRAISEKSKDHVFQPENATVVCFYGTIGRVIRHIDKHKNVNFNVGTPEHNVNIFWADFETILDIIPLTQVSGKSRMLHYAARWGRIAGWLTSETIGAFAGLSSRTAFKVLARLCVSALLERGLLRSFLGLSAGAFHTPLKNRPT